MPLRKLFQSLPGLLPRLKPCLLMSPLSVAQYLSPDMERVDLVIFDEASQMPVWDSIGAIARGNAVIVVGDSKQLPPPSFFEKAITEDDDIQDGDIGVDEVESILDECEAANLPTMRLLWHYRSQHESLIAFSNAFYYDNRLMTFPSVVSTADGLGVSLRHLEDGLYDRGASRTNQREAEFIVAEIVRRIHAAGDPASGPSLGVVAFSQAQQRRIEDLLDEARRQHPEIEDWFGEAAAEPVFVKNLENVQGDERDVILFSICYGPDAAGKITMAFGPLNRDG
ncbi:MAG: DNA2/NAM7 family helicase, partial [Salinibacterium sp.]|nr:DNA2/NAM7 family helicase [Salinibacterium sp.]